MIYKENKLKEISFPLGGIGTGCIGLSGNGRLIDWEIFNKPNKGSTNGFSHFAIKAESKDCVVSAKILNSDLLPPYTGAYTKELFSGYGFGPNRETMAGMPHFKDVEFDGQYPIAALNFMDGSFPGKVRMTAFNPLIPTNDRDSSIPAAYFEFEIENDTQDDLTYTICCSVNNPFDKKTSVNQYFNQDGIHYILLKDKKYPENDIHYGNLTIATDTQNVAYQEYWYRGTWFDNLSVFWRDFSAFGKLKNRTYSSEKLEQNGSDVCSLASTISLSPNEKKNMRFVLTWHVPNNYNYWNPEKDGPHAWKNYYAVLFQDSIESSIYSLKNWNRLYKDTLLFKDALFSSTLPPEVLDAVSANISILKSPTCLRLEDGSFYGFEGVHCDCGSCEGSCTHVWNYAYALPFLFPKLERSIRDLDFKYNQRPDGGMSFRLQLPIGRERSTFRPCADGQFGGVIKAYRDWKISGDSEWLKQNWQAIKKSIDFAWAETNQDMWDADKDGVLEGRQHHTLDMELFGPNSWLTGFYLAALKAGAEMSDYLGDQDKATEYRNLFEKGKAWTNEHLFNGEYYQQLIDLKEIGLLKKYLNNNDIMINNSGTVLDAYWNDEAKEIKYQIAEGCGIDQVVAQWHANICGLGEIFNKRQVKTALTSLYKNNFKKNMREHYNPCRIYCLNDEAGIVVCEWPKGKYRPAIPLPYAEETQNGYEYQAATHMIQEGLFEEGLSVVRAIRGRYDGERRNPWNEFECGNNYARSMASYALLLAISGFEFDMVTGKIGFNSEYISMEKFQCFWSLDSGWGIFSVTENQICLKVLYGNLKIRQFDIPFINYKEISEVCYESENLDYSVCGSGICFSKPIILDRNHSLLVTL